MNHNNVLCVGIVCSELTDQILSLKRIYLNAKCCSEMLESLTVIINFINYIYTLQSFWILSRAKNLSVLQFMFIYIYIYNFRQNVTLKQNVYILSDKMPPWNEKFLVWYFVSFWDVLYDFKFFWKETNCAFFLANIVKKKQIVLNPREIHVFHGTKRHLTIHQQPYLSNPTNKMLLYSTDRIFLFCLPTI